MKNEHASELGLLRAISKEELPLMLSWRNAPSVRANMYTSHEISLTEHLQWWDRISTCADQQYFMYERQGTPLGIVAFNAIDQGNQNSFWAFYAAPDAPKGTGSRMEFLALDHAFSNINLHKLNCEVLAFNMPVIRLHEKFGFKVEGVFRDQHKRIDEFVDIYRLGILSREWADKRSDMLNKLLHLSNG